ncbi:MAG: RNA-binding protein [Pseudomonadales bacterium]|jgi:RNA-binding protein
MALTNDEKKHMRAIGHNLKPIVTIAGKGLHENVTTEITRGLKDHELIKVSIKVGDRDARMAISTEICAQNKAQLVQSIGHTVLLYKAAKKPDPKLSNLLREKAQ